MKIKSLLILSLLATSGLCKLKIEQQYNDGTSYISSEPFQIDAENIKHNNVDGAGVVVIFTAEENNKKYVVAAKRNNPDSQKDEYEVGIGGGFNFTKDFSVAGALNEFLNYKSGGLLGNLQSNDLDKKAISLFAKGEGWAMNRVTFVARKNISDLEALKKLVIEANEKNALLSDFRSKIQYGIFCFQDVLNSADITYEHHDKNSDRAAQVKELQVIDYLNGQVVPDFVVFDDRALALIKYNHEI